MALKTNWLTINNLRPHFAFVFAVVLFSCGQPGKKSVDTLKEGNTSTTFSTTIEELENLINLDKYRPSHVKFKYVFVDNSAQQQRLSVPGPSDSNLEAILYFDDTTFSRLTADNLKLSTTSKGGKEIYQFDWLDNEIKIELSQVDSSFGNFSPYFFSRCALRSGGYLMLKNKILIRLYTN